MLRKEGCKLPHCSHWEIGCVPSAWLLGVSWVPRHAFFTRFFPMLSGMGLPHKVILSMKTMEDSLQNRCSRFAEPKGASRVVRPFRAARLCTVLRIASACVETMYEPQNLQTCIWRRTPVALLTLWTIQSPREPWGDRTWASCKPGEDYGRTGGSTGLQSWNKWGWISWNWAISAALSVATAARKAQPIDHWEESRSFR